MCRTNKFFVTQFDRIGNFSEHPKIRLLIGFIKSKHDDPGKYLTHV